MTDYWDMTMWQLEQERQKIVAEIERRIVLAKRAKGLGLDEDAAYEPSHDGDNGE